MPSLTPPADQVAVAVALRYHATTHGQRWPELPHHQGGNADLLLDAVERGVLVLDAETLLSLARHIGLPTEDVVRLLVARGPHGARSMARLLDDLGQALWTLLALDGADETAMRRALALALAAMLTVTDLLPTLGQTQPRRMPVWSLRPLVVVAGPLAEGRPLADLAAQLRRAQVSLLEVVHALDPACATPSHPVARLLTDVTRLLTDLTRSATLADPIWEVADEG